MIEITKEDIAILSYKIEKIVSKEELYRYVVLMVLADVIQADVEAELKERLIIMMLNFEEEKMFKDSFIRRQVASIINNDGLFEDIDSDSRIQHLIAYDGYCDNILVGIKEEL